MFYSFNAFNLKLSLLILHQILVFILSAPVQEEITNIYLSNPKKNGVLDLNFTAFGETRHHKLTPITIFTPDFAIWSSDGNSLKQLNGGIDFGTLYSLSAGLGSIHVTRENENFILLGNVDDNLEIKPHNSGNNQHIISKIRRSNQKTHNLNETNLKNLTLAAQSRSKRDTPDEVTVEILVVLDYLNAKKLNFDHDKIITYISLFWSNVNKRFSDAKFPTISLAISGLVLFEGRAVQPFIGENLIEENRIDGNILLTSFREWLKEQKIFPIYDVAILQTRIDAGTLDNGNWKDDMSGRATMGGACMNNGRNTGFVEDVAPSFSGVQIAAHELGHLLNSPHDGEPEASRCPSSGYVMKSSGELQWKFSGCSLRIMNEFIRSEKAKCLYNNPKNVPLATDWPFTMIESLDEQCKLLKGDTYKFFGRVSESICEKLYCANDTKRGDSSNRGAVEGTPCNIQKICLDGQCTPSSTKSLDEQCKDFKGEGFYAVNKTDPNICSNLQCKDDSGEPVSIGQAQIGSLCGNLGTCINNKCLFEVLSLDDQCKRNFGDGFIAYVDDFSEVCTKLWCGETIFTQNNKGPADVNSYCGKGNVCQNETCVKSLYS